MYYCYNCNRNFEQGAIHFAYDRSFCSGLCRQTYLSDNKFDKKNISWKNIPAKLESSGIVYPYPNFKSTKSILKGLDNIDISSLQSQYNNCNYEYNSINLNNDMEKVDEDYRYYIPTFIISCFYRGGKLNSLVTIFLKGLI